MDDQKRLSPFTEQVIKTIKAIPRGRVATYGQIAELAGKPGAARAINWILSSCGSKYGLPWQRVIGAGGHIKFPRGSANYRLQARLLKGEGVPSLRGDIDLLRFGWKRKPAATKRGAQPRMFA